MTWLVFGLILFLGVHSISIIAPAGRDRMAAALGNGWRALYSIASIAGAAGMTATVSAVADNGPPEYRRRATSPGEGEAPRGAVDRQRD